MRSSMTMSLTSDFLSTESRCVKTLKSLGFLPSKGSNKIQISNLTRDKIKKLSNLRVI